MKNPTRKSTALVTLVLVPLNLLGLGFTGCDSAEDDGSNDFFAATDDEGSAGDATAEDFDFADPNDPYNLDPVPNATGGPTTVPTTQPLAQSGFTNQPNYSHYRPYHGGGFFFLPIPYRSGYVPPRYYSNDRPGGPGTFTGGFARPGYRSGSSYSRSSGGGSGVSRSSGTSRGGFGSTGHSMSSGS